MNFFLGRKLYENKNLVTIVGYDLVYEKRTLKERFFTKLYGKKWNPFAKMELVRYPRFVPDPNFYFTKDCVFAHPEMIRKIREREAKHGK